MAKVRGGAFVPDATTDLPEGTSVTVIADDETGFDLAPDQEAELRDAVAEADRGDVLSAAEVFRRLGR